MTEVVPAVVGSPLMTPAEDKVSPAGRELPLAKLQVTGALPPVEVRVALYAVPIVAVGTEFVVIASVLRTIEIVKFAVAVCCGVKESAAFTVKVLLPAAVGVPLITPAADNVSPAGRVPEDTVQVMGVAPPVATRGVEG